MKAVIINHHPDCMYYIHEALKALGEEVFIADEDLTRTLSPERTSSTVDGKFDLAGVLFPASKWNFSPKFISKIDAGDLVFTIHGGIAQSSVLKNNKVIMDIRNQHWLGRSYGENVTLVTNHVDYKRMGCQYVSNYIAPAKLRTSPKLFTAINSNCSHPLYQRIQNDMGESCRLVGAPHAPHGVVEDDVILDETLVLGHEKTHAVHSYCVHKALDRGIPVYTTRQTYNIEGHLPGIEELFMFSDEVSPVEAYNRAKTLDPHEIQRIYRQHHNLETTVGDLQKVLENI